MDVRHNGTEGIEDEPWSLAEFSKTRSPRYSSEVQNSTCTMQSS